MLVPEVVSASGVGAGSPIEVTGHCVRWHWCGFQGEFGFDIGGFNAIINITDSASSVAST